LFPFCLATSGEIFQDSLMKTTAPFKNSISCSLWRNDLLPITLVLACIAFLQGAQAVSPPPDGDYPGGNTAEGQNALLNLTTGVYNTAGGLFSLESNITGNFNTAIGAGTLLSNTVDNNTATGAGALLSNTTGESNTANGVFSLFDNTTGGSNTSTGFAALGNNTTGSFNTANGVNALLNKEYDPTQTLAFGLIAEEVAEMAPDLVGRNPNGQPESVRYEQINAMLLNEFLKEHRKMEEQGAIIARQQKQIEALSSGLDKVNAQLATASLPLRTAGGLEASKPGTRTASE
jgi:hypothetical protein